MAGKGRPPGRGSGRGPRRDPRREPERPGPSTTALPLPESTARVLDTSRRPGDDDNVGLWLDKFAYRERDGWDIKEKYREYAFDQFNRSWRSPLGKQALDRRWQALQQTHEQRLCDQFHARVQGRLLVDYGRASAIEAGLGFHHTWGVPRIAGSAVKGIALLAMRDQGAGNADIEAIFGTQPGPDGKLPKNAHAGQVVFFDALPQDGAFALAEDVLTPHYSPYYRGDDEWPGDWHSPVPHTFLTVVDTTFVFHLAAHPLPTTERGDAKEFLKKAVTALQEGLKWHGIGAKTAAGYGRLSKVDAPPDAVVQELDEWLEARKSERTTQRQQLERLRSEWSERLQGLEQADRERAAEVVRNAIKSPKLTEQRDAFLQELNKK